VGINLHEQLLILRRRQVDGPALEGRGRAYRASLAKRSILRLAAWVLVSPRRSAWAGALLRFVGRVLPAALRLGPLGRWSQTRDLPEFPRQSFQVAYAARSKGASGAASASREQAR
jgi:L-lactate dehydrogenase complex protein LldF